MAKKKLTTIHKDVDELMDWVAQRNKNLKQGDSAVKSTRFEDLPTLGKVIFRGELGIKELPADERSKYTEYFKKNGSRIAVLTAVNPMFGLGTLGAEAAANGLISTKASVGTAAAGAGLVGAGKIAIASIPSCLSASAMSGLAFIPGLQIVGASLFALGAGATLFKAVEKLPQGKKMVELFAEAQAQHNDCYIKLESNIIKIGDVLSDKIKQAAKQLEAASKKIAISIDDVVHSDQNLRIMQYNEILLGLFNNQAEIVETLSQIADCQVLIEENDDISKRINEHKISLQLLICSAEYLK